MEMGFTATDAEGEEFEVTVEYNYHAGCRGARERGTGLQLEPDEGAEIEIVSVTDEDGKYFELSEEDTETVIEEAVDDAEESYEDAKGEAMIAAYEARMDY